MELDEQSVNTMLNGMKEVRIHEIIYPGSEVPRWFSYQSKGSTVPIDYGPTARFYSAICCVIISQDSINAGDRHQFGIFCTVTLHQSQEVDTKVRRFRRNSFIDDSSVVVVPERTIPAISDHVYIWCNKILPKSVGGKVRFRFWFESDEKKFTVKGCGVQNTLYTDVGRWKIGSCATASERIKIRRN
ncbi:hypothetical protein L6164_037358 [Bauhinia variegata]|uniref:Uncharacterized protein n=1 Tax=Bauhinia variegata TaxID=167791 RepID=A0ACB9KK44_BAUVA|nr:hypothetical protein L6164_037358 [Bauhinia variegata]